MILAVGTDQSDRQLGYRDNRFLIFGWFLLLEVCCDFVFEYCSVGFGFGCELFSLFRFSLPVYPAETVCCTDDEAISNSTVQNLGTAGSRAAILDATCGPHAKAYERDDWSCMIIIIVSKRK